MRGLPTLWDQKYPQFLGQTATDSCCSRPTVPKSQWHREIRNSALCLSRSTGETLWSQPGPLPSLRVIWEVGWRWVLPGWRSAHQVSAPHPVLKPSLKGAWVNPSHGNSRGQRANQNTQGHTKALLASHHSTVHLPKQITWLSYFKEM